MWRQFRPELDSPHLHAGINPSPIGKRFGAAYSDSGDVVICRIPIDKLWDLNYAMEKICRFNKDVFLDVAGNLVGKVFERGMTSVHFGI
jgi:hypothetical protein